MCIPLALYGKKLQFSWKSREKLHYQTITVFDDKVIIDESQVFVFYYEADAWDDNVKCCRNYVCEDIMICLHMPRTEDVAKKGVKINGYFKLREKMNDGAHEWQRQPFEFVLRPDSGEKQTQSEHGDEALLHTEHTLEDEEKRLLQELEKIRERKMRLQSKRSVTT